MTTADLAQRLIHAPTTITQNLSTTERAVTIEQMLTDLKCLAHIDGYTAATWVLELLDQLTRPTPPPDPNWEYYQTWITLMTLEAASQRLKASLIADNPDMDALRIIYTQVATLETQAGEGQW